MAFPETTSIRNDTPEAPFGPTRVHSKIYWSIVIFGSRNPTLKVKNARTALPWFANWLCSPPAWSWLTYNDIDKNTNTACSLLKCLPVVKAYIFYNLSDLRNWRLQQCWRIRNKLPTTLFSQVSGARQLNFCAYDRSRSIQRNRQYRGFQSIGVRDSTFFTKAARPRLSVLSYIQNRQFHEHKSSIWWKRGNRWHNSTNAQLDNQFCFITLYTPPVKCTNMWIREHWLMSNVSQLKQRITSL